MNRQIKFAIVFLFVFIFTSSFTTLFAVEDQFEVSLTVTGVADVVAPSQPTNLSAVAVSTSQINLSWTASTDNVAVTAYRVYRDSVFVATSTGLTYSDTGLSAGTLYSYEVSAVDAAFNESVKSTPASATTLSAEAPPTGTGQFSKPSIYDVLVIPGLTKASISWKTLPFTTSVLEIRNSFGQTIQTLPDSVFKDSNTVLVSDLLAGSEYSFVISVYDTYGKTNEYEGKFETSLLPEGILNASDFQATGRTEDILLTWINPDDPRFEKVRIVKSDKFFPVDPLDGEIIFEGDAESFVDTDVKKNKTYYYTLFVEDRDGNFSSGTLSSARLKVPGEDKPGKPFEDLPKSEFVHPQIEKLKLLDFEFIQEGKRITSFSGGSVVIDGNKNLTILLKYEKVPEILKTIAVTLTSPDDSSKVFSFLLRVNKEKTGYETTIGPLGISGIYGIDISVLDYKNQGLKKIKGNLIATVIEAHEGISFLKNTFLHYRFSILNLLFFIIIAVLLTYALKKIWKKRDENKQKFGSK